MKSKIRTREEVVQICCEQRGIGKRIGLTSGAFDVLHAGHVEYLEYARTLVDVLVVAVNSDESVRSYKSPGRPINGERERAEVIAGLQSVDHVFVFSERNNNLNVELLKPDVYIKAGDYTAESLSSRGIVESYGGRVEIVPFKAGFSTTGVIEKIAALSRTEEGEQIVYERRPAVFVDRDGTVNEHIEYLSDPAQFREIPGSFAALKSIRDLGFRIVIVTNQPGIGLGYFSKEDFFVVNREMMRQASSIGCFIDKVYFCPHSKGDSCQCRKPNPYFIERAVRELNVDLSKSFVIGDMTSDIQLGKNAGCRSVLVKTGRGGEDRLYDVRPDYVVSDLREVVSLAAEVMKAADLVPQK
jgi:rfaE bifunctional protein nucleotidyltransferase chain/domain